MSRKLEWGVLALVVLLAVAACGIDEELEAQRARLASEHAERMAELERLEVRLIQSVATTRMWEELGRRHEQVSEIACENAAQHVQEMVALQRRLFARVADTRLASAHLRRGAASN